MQKYAVILRKFVIAATFGFAFYELGIFLPWLLGPMVALLLLRQYTKLTFICPELLRQIGLIILGIQIGYFLRTCRSSCLCRFNKMGQIIILRAHA